MQSTISLIVFIASITFVSAQRITFDDPDLTFSFKKPKSWEVFDNGYVVKVSPSARDTSDVYFTITYFESPTPMGSFSEVMDIPLQEKPVKAPEPQKTVNIGQYLLKMESTIATEDSGAYMQHRYQFDHHGQSWEITTCTPESKAKKLHKLFKRMIKSLRIDQ